MSLKKIFALVAGALIAMVSFQSCEIEDAVPADDENYYFTYDCMPATMPVEMVPADQAKIISSIIDTYRTAFEAQPGFSKISNGSFRLKGVKLHDAIKEVQEAAKSVESAVNVIALSLNVPVFFIVNYTSSNNVEGNAITLPIGMILQ